MENQKPRYYQFGEYKLDSRRRILCKNDGEIPISAKNYDLLFELIKNEGRIMSHDELLDTVWEGTFVEQSNLKKGISALRHILGETPESSLYIKTIPRKGYSFIAPVQTFSDEKPIETIHVTATQIIIEEEIIEDDEPIHEIKILPPAPSQISFWKQSNKFIFGGLAVLILGIAAFSYNKFFTKQSTRFSVENVKITKLTNDGNCYDASISADGNFILCGTFSNEGNGLMTRQVSSNSQFQIVPPQKDVSFWAYRITPDGNSVFYILNDKNDASRSGLYQIPFLGGNRRKISDKANGGITFSLDNKKIAFVRIDSELSKIITMNLDGSDEKVLTEYGLGHRIWGISWSPDGKTILTSVRQQTTDKSLGFVDEVSIVDGEKTKIFPEQEKMVVGATWMPDKTSILLGIRELNSEVRQIWQYFPATKELLRVTNDNNTYRFLVLNQAGTMLSTSQESRLSAIYIGEPNSKEIRNLTNENGSYSIIFWLKDNRFVYTAFEEGSEAIWIMNADGTNKQRITDGKDGTNLNPRLASDGNSIVFTSMRTGVKNLWRVNLDGLGLIQLTQNDGDLIFEGRLLSNNKTLFGLSQTKAGFFVWRQNENEAKVNLVQTDFSTWDISPDDKLLLYQAFNTISNKNEIVVRSLENNEILSQFDASTERILRWISTNSFVYSTKKDGKTQVFKQTLDKKPPSIIYQQNDKPNDGIISIAFSPDEKKFALVSGKYLVDAVTIKIDETK